MHFDWQQFCDHHRIPYVTRGPNTAREHISIQCPFCGSADPSQHMGMALNPAAPVWGCMRNPEHRGKSPVRLVMALLACSLLHAMSIVNSSAPEFDDFEKLVHDMQTRDLEAELVVAKRPPGTLDFLPEFREVRPSGIGGRFMAYLRDRGLEPTSAVVNKYGLRYAVTGPFKYRLIIPFYSGSKLVGWTGRALGRASLRYSTLSASEEVAKDRGLPQALVDVDEYVMQDHLVHMGNDVLVICEGPMDYIKLDFFKPSPAITVTCIFGMPKGKQVESLANAARKYRKVLVLLDADAFSVGFKLATDINELSGTFCQAVEVPAKDPGEMTPDQIKKLLGDWV